MRKPTILVDLSKLKNPYCGLGQVSLSFGKAISKIKYDDFELCFLIPKEYKNFFGDSVLYEKVSFKRQLSPKFCKKYNIWHSIHQDSPYFPSDTKTPYILTVHDLNFLEEKTPKKANKRLLKLQNKINRASAITAISEYTKKAIQQNFNIPDIPFKVIYNGVDLDEFHDAEKPTFFNGGEFLFTIGVIKAKKNFHVLVDFLTQLPELKLIIAGDKTDVYAQNLQKNIIKAGLENRIILPGKITESEKCWLYKNCKAFVFPSLLEGFGLPVIEAMKFGKPVFLSTHSSLPEIGGSNAYYWEYFEPKNMAEIFNTKMQEFLSDTQKAKNIKLYAEKFSWDIATKQYIDLYLEILISNKPTKQFK